MIELVLFLFIFVITFKKKNLEGLTNRSCCGNLDSNLIDFTCSGNPVPHGIKNCYPEDYKYDCDDCGDICNGQGTCIPTLNGGYCKINPTKAMVYEGNEWKEKKKNFGRKINESERAKNEYRNRYSKICDPFATKVSEEDIEENVRRGDFTNEFSELDDMRVGAQSVDEGTERMIARKEESETSYLMYILVPILVLVIVGLSGFAGYKFYVSRKIKKGPSAGPSAGP
tara:strand:- start:94 stop:774 length:681 start_codon:yes stop_codon:yes gene_type:complete